MRDVCIDMLREKRVKWEHREKNPNVLVVAQINPVANEGNEEWNGNW